MKSPTLLLSPSTPYLHAPPTTHHKSPPLSSALQPPALTLQALLSPLVGAPAQRKGKAARSVRERRQCEI